MKKLLLQRQYGHGSPQRRPVIIEVPRTFSTDVNDNAEFEGEEPVPAQPPSYREMLEVFTDPFGDRQLKRQVAESRQIEMALW